MKHLTKTLNKLLLHMAILLCVVMLSSCGAGKKSLRGADGIVLSDGTVVQTTEHRGRLVNTAHTWLGSPYRYGGHSRKGTDCSGFLMEVYREALGIDIPRSSHEQREYCRRIDKSKLQPGDIVFFSSRASEGKTAHVAMYIGSNKIIHASTSSGVIISDLDEAYYTRHYIESGIVDSLASLDRGTGTIGQADDNPTNLDADRSVAAPVDTQPQPQSKTKKKRRGLRR